MEQTKKEEEEAMPVNWKHEFLGEKTEIYNLVRSRSIAEKLRIENPFDVETFPFMKAMVYDKMTNTAHLLLPEKDSEGDPLNHAETVRQILTQRYRKQEDAVQLNDANVGFTKPRLYNVVADDATYQIYQMAYDNDIQLVMKVVDLGRTKSVYDPKNLDGRPLEKEDAEVLMAMEETLANHDEGNFRLNEIYNEIRTGYFLGEQRFGYPHVTSTHFMAVLDWFVLDENLFPDVAGVGPYQYIVSERLDVTLHDYLSQFTDMETLLCSLYSIGQALESIWSTNAGIHYDLHLHNIMVKENADQSRFFQKNYLYTRPYDKRLYRLPVSGLHNASLRIIDFGRCRFHIPPEIKPTDANDQEPYAIYEHIDEIGAIHDHNRVIFYDDISRGVGAPKNRTWDLRRLLWDLITLKPVEYWQKLEDEDADKFEKLMIQCEHFMDMKEMERLCKADKLNQKELFLTGQERRTTGRVVRMRDIAMSHIRELTTYLRFYDDKYDEARFDFERWERALEVAKERFHFEMTDKQFRELFKTYLKWYFLIHYSLVFSQHQNHHNASTFLSSNLFDHFVITDKQIDTREDAWAGQRAYAHMLNPRELYFDTRAK